MNYTATLDLTQPWSSQEEIAKHLNLATDGYCYVVENDDELAHVFVLTPGSSLYGSFGSVCIAPTAVEALNRVAELAGVK